ncbi:hypothetical protein CRUP_006682, partial [Coryphaenoides rupestris]
MEERISERQSGVPSSCREPEAEEDEEGEEEEGVSEPTLKVEVVELEEKDRGGDEGNEVVEVEKERDGMLETEMRMERWKKVQVVMRVAAYAASDYRLGEFVSDVLLVPEKCKFFHKERMDMCVSHQQWHDVAKQACGKSSMVLHSYGMLLPCGVDKFQGTEYVCCPSLTPAEPAPPALPSQEREKKQEEEEQVVDNEEEEEDDDEEEEVAEEEEEEEDEEEEVDPTEADAEEDADDSVVPVAEKPTVDGDKHYNDDFDDEEDEEEEEEEYNYAYEDEDEKVEEKTTEERKDSRQEEEEEEEEDQNLREVKAVCGLEPEPGPCRASMPRWHFDMVLRKCVRFVYGGCSGNRNNFDTAEYCMAVCRRLAVPPTPQPTDDVDIYFETPADDKEHSRFQKAKEQLEVRKEWEEAEHQAKNLPRAERQTLVQVRKEWEEAEHQAKNLPRAERQTLVQ